MLTFFFQQKNLLLQDPPFFHQFFFFFAHSIVCSCWISAAAGAPGLSTARRAGRPTRTRCPFRASSWRLPRRGSRPMASRTSSGECPCKRLRMQTAVPATNVSMPHATTTESTRKRNVADCAVVVPVQALQRLSRHAHAAALRSHHVLRNGGARGHTTISNVLASGKRMD